MIGARRINDHHFVQHLQSKTKKWDLVADSQNGGFTLSKDMVVGLNPINIIYKAMSPVDHRTPEQCQSRWKIIAAEYRNINVMQSEQNILNLIRTKNYQAPSHRDEEELRGEIMDAISKRKEKFKFWENMNLVGWSLSDYLNPSDRISSNNSCAGSGRAAVISSPAVAATPSSSNNPLARLPLTGPEDPTTAGEHRLGGGRTVPVPRGKGKQLQDFAATFAAENRLLEQERMRHET